MNEVNCSESGAAKRSVFSRIVMWFKRGPKLNGTPIRKPIKGEKWGRKDGSPWPRSDRPVVTILDVKDGWVRYDMGGTIFKDERMVMSSFLYCYKFSGDT